MPTKGQRTHGLVLYRHRERVQLDTFYDNNTAEFVLRLFHPDGRQEVERFASVTQFREGIERTEKRLLAERWKQDDEPIFPRGSRSVGRTATAAIGSSDLSTFPVRGVSTRLRA